MDKQDIEKKIDALKANGKSITFLHADNNDYFYVVRKTYASNNKKEVMHVVTKWYKENLVAILFLDYEQAVTHVTSFLLKCCATNIAYIRKDKLENFLTNGHCVFCRDGASNWLASDKYGGAEAYGKYNGKNEVVGYGCSKCAKEQETDLGIYQAMRI